MLLESTDEEEDDPNGDRFPYADLMMDGNPDPTDMEAQDPVPENNDFPFNPLDRHVSWEDCNMLERARLMVELQNAERAATQLICSYNRNFNGYETYAREMRVLAQNRNGQYTLNGLKQLEKDRKVQKSGMRTRERLLMERLRRARRLQFYLTQQFQAVLNGILFRAMHPNQPFVIYIREEEVMLQRTRYPTDDFRDVFQSTPPAPPGPRRRKPRSNGHNATRQLLPGCDKPMTRFDLITITELNIRVESADDVVTYLGLASMETKLIKINVLNKNSIRLEEQTTALDDIFNAFSWTLEGYFTSVYYHKMYQPVHEEMEKIRSLLKKLELNVDKKLDVILYLKTHFMNELKKDLKWYYYPSSVIADTIRVIQKASSKLLYEN